MGRRVGVGAVAVALAVPVAAYASPAPGEATRDSGPVGVAAASAVEVPSPALASLSAGRRDLFWTSNGDVRHRFRTGGGSWLRALNRGGTPVSQPAVVSWGAGRLDVFVRGSDNRLWWLTRDTGGSWSTWRSLGGTLTSAPTAASRGAGLLDVFARGVGGDLYHRAYANGLWSAWTNRGGDLTSAPSAASWGPGRLDVVVRGSRNGFSRRSWTATGGWGGWGSVGGTFTSQPAVASPGVGALDVFGRDAAGQLLVRSLRSGTGWSSWTSVGSGTVTSGPGTYADGDTVVVAALRPDGFYHEKVRATPGGSWSAWRVVDVHQPFRRLGTWADVFDYASLNPETAVADMASQGVRTLYLSTARFSTPADPAEDFYDEAKMGAFLDAAHAAGIKVVGWYPPAYGNMARDVRRVLAIAGYVSPGGQRFDGVGVDIERYGTEGEVDRATFNVRAVQHLQQVRAADPTAVVAAIVPPPYATDPGTRWEGFPWSGVATYSDVTVPMALWSNRTNPGGGAFSGDQVYAWVLDQTRRTATLTSQPVHVEGGSNDGTGLEPTPITAARTSRFVDAVRDGGAIGGSHYDYLTTFDEVTRLPLWSSLAPLNTL